MHVVVVIVDVVFFLFCSFYLSAKKERRKYEKNIFPHFFYSFRLSNETVKDSVKWMELSDRERNSGRKGKEKKFENSIRIINRNELNRHNWCLCTLFGLLEKIS